MQTFYAAGNVIHVLYYAALTNEISQYDFLTIKRIIQARCQKYTASDILDMKENNIPKEDKND